MRITGNHVLLEPLPLQDRSSGGVVYAPRYLDNDPKLWRVLQTGWGQFRVKRGKRPVFLEMEVAAGDRVVVDVSMLGARALNDGTGRYLVDHSIILAKF
jgi:hypothetical protein